MLKRNTQEYPLISIQQISNELAAKYNFDQLNLYWEIPYGESRIEIVGDIHNLSDDKRSRIIREFVISLDSVMV